MSVHASRTDSPPGLSIPRLATSVVGSRVFVYEQVESTNDRALRFGGEGAVIVADRQTAGRGRHGRAWHSGAGLGLWFSVAFESPIEGLAFAAPLSVQEALRAYGPATVKWPNDVLLDGKKVCGILLETRRGRTALGIGINVHHRPEDFPGPLRAAATSVEAATGRRCDRGVLLRDVLTNLDEMVMVLRAGGVGPIWRKWAAACGMVGRRVRSDRCEGVVAAIDRDGALIVEAAGGLRRVLLGEVLEGNGT